MDPAVDRIRAGGLIVVYWTRIHLQPPPLYCPAETAGRSLPLRSPVDPLYHSPAPSASDRPRPNAN